MHFRHRKDDGSRTNGQQHRTVADAHHGGQRLLQVIPHKQQHFIAGRIAESSIDQLYAIDREDDCKPLVPTLHGLRQRALRLLAIGDTHRVVGW